MKIHNYTEFLNETEQWDRISVRKGKFDGMFQKWNVTHPLLHLDGVNLYTKPGRDGIDQIHIELPERLSGKGLATAAIKALILKNGTAYSAFGRRVNPLMDKVHAKLSADNDIEHIRYEGLGDLYLSKDIDPTRKKKITDSLDRAKKYWDDMEKTSESIYHKDSGTKIYINKFADEDKFRVYYSTYKPMGTGDDFMSYLKKGGFKYNKSGKNSISMSKGEVEKLKRSMLVLESIDKTVCPICSEKSVTRCKCASFVEHDRVMLENGHGQTCPNGHRWSYNTKNGNPIII